MQWGNTALHYAASKGDSDEVCRLIEDGANCNAASLDGSTAMHCAAARNCASIVELLMTRGASPAVMDKVTQRTSPTFPVATPLNN